MRSTSRIVISLLLLAIAGGMGYLAYQQYLATPVANGGFAGPAAAALVVAETVSLQVMPDEIEAIGTVKANESVTVSAKVTETVRAVNFSDGDYVKRGAVLLELTNEEQTAQLAEARANLDDARNQLKRVEDLAKQGSIPISQVDETRSRFAATEARLEGILARLSDRLIRAPFSGLLGFRTVSPGTLVTPNTPITTLDDISVAKLDFSVPENFYGLLAADLPVTAEGVAWPGREFHGKVVSIGSRVDPVTRAVPVRAEFANEDLALRPGMLLTVHLYKERPASVVLAESAVIQRQDRSYVYRIVDGQALLTEVGVGRRRRGIVEILTGLNPEDRVVVDGVARLRDGTRVREESGS